MSGYNGGPTKKLDHPKLKGFDFQGYLEAVTRNGAECRCLLCGAEHAVHVHARCERLVRCPDGRNHQLLIVSIICEQAKQQGTQYTKRILPPFAIPECNIRLDLVLRLMAQQGTATAVNYDTAYALVGSACEGTIARHLQWAQQQVAATLLEVSKLLAVLVPFGVLPEVRVGHRGLPVLRQYVAALAAAGRKAHGASSASFTVIGCLHVSYVFERARSPLAVSLDQVLRRGCWFDTS